MRIIALIALAAILAGCGLFATPSPSPTVSASAQATATATVQATATPTPAPTPSPRPNPTAGPGTYTNAGLGYRVEIPAGWRRSQCQTTRGDPKVPFVETFTTGTVDEELGTDIGPASDVVYIRSEDAAGLTALQWLSSRGGAGTGSRFESFTFDGKDAARAVPIAGGAATAFVVPGRGRMFVLSRGQRVFEPNTAVGANALINSFHVLTDAELAGPPFATPTPGPTRTAEDVAGAVAKGFTQKDTTALEPMAWACLTHGVENGGAGLASLRRRVGLLRHDDLRRFGLRSAGAVEVRGLAAGLLDELALRIG